MVNQKFLLKKLPVYGRCIYKNAIKMSYSKNFAAYYVINQRC